MKTILFILILGCSINMSGQDSTMTTTDSEKKPVEIFSSEKAINANTPETVGKGKMAFKVFHNFGDIGGVSGGIKNFFGLDVTTDVKIDFEIGLGKKFDLILGRAKGGIIQQLWELGLKYQFMQQIENDNPLAIAIFANTVVSTEESGHTGPESEFEDFGDRLSNVIQLIFARRFGNISLQLNPTYVHRGFAVPYDKKNTFAIGGAVKFPLVPDRLNLLIDYFHPFRSEAVKDSFLVRQNIKFYDPLGIGFEILKGGHVFRLNFTNCNQILENRFIPRTANSWGKGQFRWCFTISRVFTLWRD